MVKNQSIHVRVSARAKEGIERKANDCSMTVSEFLEEIGKRPISFIEVIKPNTMAQTFKSQGENKDV